jgi:hypothetical protein
MTINLHSIIKKTESGVSKQGKDWTSYLVVGRQFNKKEDLLSISVSQEVFNELTDNCSASFEIYLSSKEYNGRYFTSVYSAKVTVDKVKEVATTSAKVNNANDDLPF